RARVGRERSDPSGTRSSQERSGCECTKGGRNRTGPNGPGTIRRGPRLEASAPGQGAECAQRGGQRARTPRRCCQRSHSCPARSPERQGPHREPRRGHGDSEHQEEEIVIITKGHKARAATQLWSKSSSRGPPLPPERFSSRRFWCVDVRSMFSRCPPL